MRRETDFVLEHAAWPALVLEEAGAIRRVNHAAAQLFGPQIQDASATLASLWAEENSISAAQFLARSRGESVAAKLRLGNGTSGDFFAQAARVARDGQDYLLLQLFKQPGAQFPELSAEAQRPPAKPAISEPVKSPSPPAPVLPPPPAPKAAVNEIFVLEEASWPALLVQQGGMILRANRAAAEAFGSSIDKSGAQFSILWLPENSHSVHHFLQASHKETQRIKLRLKAGVSALFLAQVCPAGPNATVVQLQLETVGGAIQAAPAEAPGAASPGVVEPNLNYKQKLECALQLSRSVALDFNNALTSILGHTSLLLSKAEPSHPWRESLIEIEKSAAKAAEVASDLASFSRQEKEARPQNEGNLNILLERAVAGFQAEHPAIKWSPQFERRLCSAAFDEAKMQQALAKILENAVQSIRVQPGRISLQTHNLELTEATQDRTAKLNPGNYICAEISDTGEGISDEVLPRIFEPFFTTKGKNHRGLGLAWVYGIVTNHGGAVAVSSKVGVGTSVRVYLPASKKLVKQTLMSNDNLGGTQTILIVDDEDLLLTMGQMVLSSYGYTVLTANSGSKALEIISRSKQGIHLMITDLLMPNMSGRELTEQVQRLSPQTRIIWSSGYLWKANSQDEETYLQKPFNSQDLLRKVKEALMD